MDDDINPLAVFIFYGVLLLTSIFSAAVYLRLRSSKDKHVRKGLAVILFILSAGYILLTALVIVSAILSEPKF